MVLRVVHVHVAHKYSCVARVEGFGGSFIQTPRPRQRCGNDDGNTKLFGLPIDGFFRVYSRPSLSVALPTTDQRSSIISTFISDLLRCAPLYPSMYVHPSPNERLLSTAYVHTDSHARIFSQVFSRNGPESITKPPPRGVLGPGDGGVRREG